MKIKRRDAIKKIAIAGIFLQWNPFERTFAFGNSDFKSAFLKISLMPDYPGFSYFSIDSLGKSKLNVNPLIIKKTHDITFTLKSNAREVNYYLNGKSSTPAWQFIPKEKGFILKSNFIKNNIPWVILFNQVINHVTCLGIIPEPQKINTPCILHLPDMGSLRIKSDQVKQLDYDAKRLNTPIPYVQLSLPPADHELKSIEYHFNVVSIYPKIKKVENDPRYNAFKRNFINMFQVNPKLMVLANNSSSDTCAFCQYEYSELALHTPELAKGLTALDLVRMSLDRFLSGAKAYGLTGYSYDDLGSPSTHWGTSSGSLDSLPSLVIAASNYYNGTKNNEWLSGNIDKLIKWADGIIQNDTDNDGLIEYGFSGNTNSWSGSPDTRPANWWDTIGFGHKDAYSNALAYKALSMFSKICITAGKPKKAKQYKIFASRLKINYYKTFYNPQTGVLAGWKSADGQLHDYYFTFVNSIAICYDLVDMQEGNKIMDVLLKKMKDVGFTNFELGLPGNLLPIKRGDYTHHERRWGCNTSDELNDGFQIYENGGASACFEYFTIRALFKLGRKKDAEMILFPLLKSMDEGNFQGKCDNGMTKDWKTWDGECWGYEGFLVDNYLGLLSVLQDM